MLQIFLWVQSVTAPGGMINLQITVSTPMVRGVVMCLEYNIIIKALLLPLMYIVHTQCHAGHVHAMVILWSIIEDCIYGSDMELVSLKSNFLFVCMKSVITVSVCVCTHAHVHCTQMVVEY